MVIIASSVVVLLYILSAGFYLAELVTDRKKLLGPGFALLLAGMAAHAVSLVVVVGQLGAGALLNIQHSLSVLALLLGLGYLGMRRLAAMESAASFIAPLMMLLQGVSVLAEPDAAVEGSLKGALLTAHIAAALTGTAAFVLAAMTSLLYLIQDRNLRQKKFGTLYQRLPSVDALDRSHVRLVSVGFLIYTLAIALGGFFAWGRGGGGLQVQYLFAMASWLIYAGIIHARVTIGWRGRRAAGLTLFGLVGLGAVLSTYLARAAMV